MKSVNNKYAYLTVTSTYDENEQNTYQGKLFESNWRDPTFDPSNPKINKTTPFATGHSSAMTVRVSNVKEFKELLAGVSEDPNQAIVLGFAKGTEPDDTTRFGEQYQLVPQKVFAEIFPKQKAPYKKPSIHKGTGTVYACRTKGMFERSTWMGFDLDMSSHMPDELKSIIADTPYIDLLCELCPELSNVSYITVQSASSRVLHKGKPQSAFNTHIYMQCKHPSDMDRFSGSLLLRSIGTKFGYHQPVIDIETGEEHPTRRGVPSSIFDRSVFSKARVMFEGKPQLNPQDPEVLNGNLIVTDNMVQTYQLEKEYANTNLYKTPTPAEQAASRTEVSGGGGSFVMKNMTDLLPDTKIEVKDPDTGANQQIITAREFVEGDMVRYRAQNPFKPESTSWSAFLSKADYEGNPIDPMLVTQEYGSFYYNDALELFGDVEAAKTDTVIKAPAPPKAIVAPAPPVREAAMEAAIEAVKAPAPLGLTKEVSTVNTAVDIKDVKQGMVVPNRYELPPAVIEANAARKNINNPMIDITPLPDESPDDILAKEVLGFFCEPDGSSNILSKGLAREGESAWNGQHWESIPDGSLESFITKCSVEGSVKNLTANKINSVTRLARNLNKTPGEVPYLPSHMVAFQNGVFDFSTDEFLPSSAVRQYYFNSVKPFDYNPDLVGGTLEQIIIAASEGDPEFVQQAWQMAGYGIAGGDNLAHKIMYLDGVPRSGKSLLAQTISRLSQRTLAIELSKIGELKTQNNIPDRSLLYDDDARKLNVYAAELVCGEIKKLTGGSEFGIHRLYTAELLETFLHPKILIACNGLPLENDPSGAIHDRGLILKFSKSYAGSEDYGLQDRLKQPLEEAASFNHMVAGYRDLLAHNGFESMRAFTESSSKTLKFVQCESSLQAQEDSLSMAQPLVDFFNKHTTEQEDGKLILSDIEADIRQWLMGQPGQDDLRKLSIPKLKAEIRSVANRLKHTVKKTRVGDRAGIEAIIGIRSTYSAFGQNNY